MHDTSPVLGIGSRLRTRVADVVDADEAKLLREVQPVFVFGARHGYSEGYASETGGWDIGDGPFKANVGGC